MSRQKAVANLGPLEEPVIAAPKTALQAVRSGKTVVVAEEVGAQMVALSVAQSLAYLDVAVLSGRCGTSWAVDAARARAAGGPPCSRRT